MLTTTTMMICEDSISAIMLSSYDGLWRRRSHFHRLGRDMEKMWAARRGSRPSAAEIVHGTGI